MGGIFKKYIPSYPSLTADEESPKDPKGYPEVCTYRVKKNGGFQQSLCGFYFFLLLKIC